MVHSDVVALPTGRRDDFAVVDRVAGAVELSAALILHGCGVEAGALTVLPDYQGMVGVAVSEGLNVGWGTRR